MLVTEEYTSSTCSRCGHLHTGLGSSEVFRCPSCSQEIDRDVNGARNIMINTVMERTRQNG
jgi:putative transposase